MPDVDLCVVGAGAAGLSITALSAALGWKVALFERGLMGGDCLNSGCVPSKALLACAHAAHDARRAGRFGVHARDVAVDWAGVRAHVDAARAEIAPMDSEARFRGMGVEVVRATAHFVAPDTLEAAGRPWRFRRCVVAAGSSAVVPDLPGLAGGPYLTNETVFDLDAPPGHLLVLGGGPIGVEMAQAHARLGCRVTLVEAGRVLGRDDPELAEPLRDALAEEGVAVLEGRKAARVERGAADGSVTLLLDDGARVAGTHLLVALGRAPRLGALDLDAGNVRATARGIATDPALRSLSNRRVYAAGDIADPEGLGPRAFTHVAGGQHAGVLARSMIFRLPFTRLSYDALPRVTYADPELAQVGMTEAEAREAGHGDLRIHRAPVGDNDRAVAEGAERGLVKLVADRKGRLLGAGVLAPRAGEMAGLFGLMIGRKMRLSALAGTVLPYPTLAESAKRAAGEFYAPAVTGPTARKLAGLLRRLP